MNLEEIEGRYEEEKEALFQKYQNRHSKTKNKEKVKKWFDKSMHKLNTKYQKRSENALKANLKNNTIKHKIKLFFKPLIDKIKIFLERFEKDDEKSR